MEGEEYVRSPLKAIEEVFQADKQYVKAQIKIDDVHRVLAPIVLVDSVPIPVRQLFETAKNVSLYAWFVYRFHQVSEMVAYSALELALKTRYERENPVCEPKPVPRGLKQLLKHAQQEKWIENSRFTLSRTLARRSLLRMQKREIRQSGVLQKAGGNVDLTEPTDEDIDLKMAEIDVVSWIVEQHPGFRNDLAHGSTTLGPRSVTTLSMVSEIINQVYS